MCGICGFVNSGAGGRPDWLHSMAASLRHRGPDDTGFYRDGHAGLGHTRLSIVDLAGGHQPMCSTDRAVWITFNGEIFNYIELREDLIRRGHRFATRSDTEVILHLYQEEGERCVDRLNGQWAFAIWDNRCRKLFLSRDRLGVRPLFYTQTRDRFLFGSEIKALLAWPDVPRELDLEALDQIFTFWVALPARTAFRGIQQLPPGHCLTLQDGRLHVWQYWRVEFNSEAERCEPEDALAEELFALLLNATRIRLRSDVPVGAYLSGGLDSTFITALIRKIAGHRLRTFSVAFDDPAFDESDFQNEASAYLGTEHSRLRCTGADVARVLPDVVRHAEQPILRTAPAPLFLLSKLVHESGFKVVLTGEGADEILGGYDIFKEAKVRRFWARDPGSSMRPALLRRLYPYLEDLQRQPADYLKKFFHVSEADLRSPFFSHLPRWELTAKIKGFLADEIRPAVPDGTALRELEGLLPPAFAQWKPFHQAEHLETAYLLPGYILSSQGDRMAMAHAVEGRYPFLDHRVVEFAAALPPRLKMKVLDQKYLLKRSAAGWIPESIRQRCKQPYRAPDGQDFFASSNGYVQDMLAPERIKRTGIFSPNRVAALVKKFRAGMPVGTRDKMALIGILSTEILVQEFITSEAGANIRERTTQHGENDTHTQLHFGELSVRTGG